jgi:hypothetical protein
MRLRSGSAYAAAATAKLCSPQQQNNGAALPHDVLVRIFGLLPRGALAVTPGRVSHAWAAAKAEAWAASQAAAAALAAAPAADDNPYATWLQEDDVKWHPFLPSWYVRSIYASATSDARVKMISGACFHGQIDLVAYLFVVQGEFFRTDPTASCLAAGGNQLRVLKWIRKHGCFWDAETCSQAAEGGWLDMLMYLRQNGCPWCKRTIVVAARRGDLRILNNNNNNKNNNNNNNNNKGYIKP